ncbi:MAG: ArsR family transcriptional regulator [Pseudomonadales bacterium]|nr:ArsR family transcriptional regulator [Pseudomonadales bacterium]
MTMTPMVERFVFHFGEMGSRWGFNRTVGQMYGLIVLSEAPLSANELADALGISRGNVSMGLKELQSWRLLKIHHIPGDRKEYFSPAGSIIELARRVLEERVRREVEPTLTLLRDLLIENPANSQESYAQEKMREIHDLLEVGMQWAQEIQALSIDSVQTLLRLGTGVGKILEFAEKFRGGKGNKEFENIHID